MNLRHTIAAALGLAPPEQKSSRTARLLQLDCGGRARWTPRDYAALAREGYLANAIVHRSVRLVAENVGAVAWLLYDGAHDLAAHPLLDLIERPNPREDRASFLEAVAASLLISGNAYVEAVSLEGAVRELYLLRPDRMRVVPGPDGWPQAYEYNVGTQSVRFDQGAALPPILHLKFYHPLDDHYGLSALEAAAVAVEGGDGDLRYKLSKEASGNTLSLLFQDNFSGRAEVGLTGDDDLHVKTSADGSTWTDALLVDRTTGAVKLNSAFFLTGDISPAQITADQNDYNPSGLATAAVLRLSTDASHTITGLSGGRDGRSIKLVNVGANNIVLSNQDSSSSAGNRFLLGASLTLAASQAVELWYDATSSRWRPGAGAGGSASGALLAANNLSDVASASTARTNLGLGTAATLASSAVTQTANNLSDLASVSSARTNLGLGSAATLASSAVAQTANNLSDLANASSARTNLGLGSAATLASPAVAQTANNLSDLASTSSARTNLGLGTAATQNTGTSGANVALLNGANTWSGAQALAAQLDAQQDIYASGDISPSQITANQNDYTPGGLSTASGLRLNSDASRNVTGMSGGADGRIAIVHNVGSNNIVLQNQNASSSAANRFLFGFDLTLGADQSIALWYDSTNSRWRSFDNGLRNGVALLASTNTFTASGGSSFNQKVTFNDAVYFGAATSPSQITSNQNNYNQGSASQILRLSTDAERTVTGLQGNLFSFRWMTIANVGSNNIRLANENGNSSAGNRFSLGDDIVIGPGKSVALFYDGTSSRWRPHAQTRTPLYGRVASDFTKSDTTLADITGLSADVQAGRTYRFSAKLFFDADATSGHKWAIGGSATATAIVYRITAGKDSDGSIVISARQTALAGSAGQAGSTAGYVEIEGTITVNAAGTLTAQFALNAGTTTGTVKAGSSFEVIDVT